MEFRAREARSPKGGKQEGEPQGTQKATSEKTKNPAELSVEDPTHWSDLDLTDWSDLALDLEIVRAYASRPSPSIRIATKPCDRPKISLDVFPKSFPNNMWTKCKKGGGIFEDLPGNLALVGCLRWPNRELANLRMLV